MFVIIVKWNVIIQVVNSDKGNTFILAKALCKVKEVKRIIYNRIVGWNHFSNLF